MLTSEEGEDISSKDKHKFKQFAETLRIEKKIRINYSDENIYLDGRDIKKHPERREDHYQKRTTLEEILIKNHSEIMAKILRL